MTDTLRAPPPFIRQSSSFSSVSQATSSNIGARTPTHTIDEVHLDRVYKSMSERPLLVMRTIQFALFNATFTIAWTGLGKIYLPTGFFDLSSAGASVAMWLVIACLAYASARFGWRAIYTELGCAAGLLATYVPYMAFMQPRAQVLLTAEDGLAEHRALELVIQTVANLEALLCLGVLGLCVPIGGKVFTTVGVVVAFCIAAIDAPLLVTSGSLIQMMPHLRYLTCGRIYLAVLEVAMAVLMIFVQRTKRTTDFRAFTHQHFAQLRDAPLFTKRTSYRDYPGRTSRDPRDELL